MTWMMPLITRRSSTRLAPGWFLGRCGSIAAQASSLSQNSPLIHASETPRTLGITQTVQSQHPDWVRTLEAIAVPVGSTTAMMKIDVFPLAPKNGGRVCD